MVESTPAKKSRRENTKQEIIIKALKIVDKEGIDKLTVRNLALKLKKNPTALYKHFKNKDELIDYLRREQFSIVLPLMREKLGVGQSGSERLLSLSLGYLEYARLHPHLYQLTFHSKVEPIGIEEIMEIQGFKELLAIITECIEAGEITLPPLYSLQTYAFHSWITLHGIAMLLISVQNASKSDFHDLSTKMLKDFFQINEHSIT